MSNYKAIVRTYISQIRPHAQAELDWFKQQPTFSSAIRLASLAINNKGKRYSHQRRLQKIHLQEAEAILMANANYLRKCECFDDLYSIIEMALQPVRGIGELYVYDTALRIGAKLGLLPQRIYLHAGTRVGAKALGLNGNAKNLEVFAFPKEFHQLEAHEIEDVLCIFKSQLSGDNTKISDESKPSGCLSKFHRGALSRPGCC